MDPTTLIVSMVIKAAQPTVQRAIADGYQALRTMLIRKYGQGLGAAADELHRNPTSPEAKATFAAQLRRVGADRDPEIVELTADLNYLVENLDLPADANPVSRAQQRAGRNAMLGLLSEHVASVLQTRRDFDTNGDSNLLTCNLGQSGLPADVQVELAALHQRMRSLIARIAQQMQAEAYRGAEAAIAAADLSWSDQKRARDLISADRALQTSYRGLQLTVEYFREFNRDLLRRIENAADAGSEAKMMLGNAVLIFEVADFVISFITSFAPSGMSEVERLWRESQRRLESLRLAERRFLEEQQSKPSSALRDDHIEQSRNRLDAIDLTEREWGGYLQDAKRMHGMVDDVRGQLDSLEAIRDNAARQIAVLQEIALVRMLKENAMAINRTVDALEDFRLAPLAPSRVSRLLQMDFNIAAAPAGAR